MRKIIKINKPIGITPLQAIDKFRKENLKYRDIKIGIAGRLDPMAQGVLLLMIGAETKNRDKYLSLDKEYEFEVLFGVSTDTYDALGIIKSFNFKIANSSKLLKNNIKKFIESKIGKQFQPYPPYSSKEVNGKPLFQWAREKRLGEIKIPTKEIEIYNFELLEIKQIPSKKIKKRIFENINQITGDFRQNEILEKWEEFFEKNAPQTFTVAIFRISCSSGTYVRSLTNEMGEEIGYGAIALDILRTKVGEYKLKTNTKIK